MRQYSFSQDLPLGVFEIRFALALILTDKLVLV
jgi:hypothetical protein